MKYPEGITENSPGSWRVAGHYPGYAAIEKNPLSPRGTSGERVRERGLNLEFQICNRMNNCPKRSSVFVFLFRQSLRRDLLERAFCGHTNNGVWVTKRFDKR